MDGFASWWCWLFSHDEVLMVCRERGLVWECPTCCRQQPSRFATQK